MFQGGCSLKTNESGTFQTQCHECITGFFGAGKRFLGKTSGESFLLLITYDSSSYKLYSGFSLMGGGHRNDQIRCQNYDVEIEYEGIVINDIIVCYIFFRSHERND